MLTKGDESCQADDELGTEIDFTTPVNDQLPQKGPYWPVGLIDTGICRGEGLLAAHLRLTAPENEGLFLPMDGHELREDSHQLFLELKPQNAAEGMLATLAVGLFNCSLTAIAEGSRQQAPLQGRELLFAWDRSTCRKSSGKYLINLPVRSILQWTRRLLVLITMPCGGGSPQKL